VRKALTATKEMGKINGIKVTEYLVCYILLKPAIIAPCNTTTQREKKENFYVN